MSTARFKWEAHLFSKNQAQCPATANRSRVSPWAPLKPNTQAKAGDARAIFDETDVSDRIFVLRVPASTMTFRNCFRHRRNEKPRRTGSLWPGLSFQKHGNPPIQTKCSPGVNKRVPNPGRPSYASSEPAAGRGNANKPTALSAR